ncbi:hypothetical protein D3C86_1592550 [compost metagenome]
MAAVGRPVADPVHVAALPPVRTQLLQLLQLGGAVGEVVGNVVAVGRQHEGVGRVRDVVDVDLDAGSAHAGRGGIQLRHAGGVAQGPHLGRGDGLAAAGQHHDRHGGGQRRLGESLDRKLMVQSSGFLSSRRPLR